MNGAAGDSGAGAMLRIGIVAGESSGDQLGAALIDALRARVSELKCFGVAGPKMIAAGCEAWAGAEELAVMGLTEVIPHLPRLLRVRHELVKRMRAHPPDVFVGVDYKEFNLSVARKLKASGIPTVQYVSPQVWAWRPGRVKTIARAVDLVLCLLPFEATFYASHGVRALFVGHPLADQMPLECDRAVARRRRALGSIHAAAAKGERQAEPDEDDPDILDGAVGEKPLQVGCNHGSKDAEPGGEPAQRHHDHAGPPGRLAHKIEDDAHEAVNGDLGHDAAHQRGDVARCRRMCQRQPDMQRNQTGLRSGA